MPNEIPPVDCRSAMQQLWDYVDCELTTQRMEAVRRHLANCSHCLPHAQFAERFISALHETGDDCGCPGEVRAKVMAKLREAGLKLS